MDGEISKENYNTRRSKLKAEIKDIEEEIENIDNFNSYYDETHRLKDNYIDILNSLKIKLENGESEEVFKNHIEYIVVGRAYDEEKEKIIPTVEEVKFKDFTSLYKILEKAVFTTTGVF